MKTPVPGLYRGVQVWRQLCGLGDVSLDQITAASGYPKASVLRMLKTLCDLELAERSGRIGLYQACAQIIFSDADEAGFERRVSKTLETLSGQVAVAAEWFAPDAQGLRLVSRVSPPDAEVRVKARAGFLREWNGELDAVAVCGYAFYQDAPAQKNQLWIYSSKGERVKRPAAEARKWIGDAQQTGVFEDRYYNTNGVKRIAAAVMRENQLAGILSLAFVFTPSLDLEIKEKAAGLRNAADRLQE